MEKELSGIMLIAFTLLSAAIVCGVIFLGLSQSKETANAGYEKINEVNRVSDAETIQTFTRWEGQGIPAAACYTLLKKQEVIVSVYCEICGRTTAGKSVGDCLQNHMKNRIKVYLTEEESGGTYTAVMRAG